MALTPEIDGLTQRIAGLEALLTSLDGVQPIQVSIGNYSLSVDPVSMPDAYSRGSDILRVVANSAIQDLRNAVASTAIAQSQAT
jgi:hypothetical protein